MYTAISLIWCILLLSSVDASSPKNPKRGLAFADGNNVNDISHANTSSSVVSWIYDWGSSPSPTIKKSGLTYIPMQWGAAGIANFSAIVKSQGAKTILCFNEPDLASQSNIDPKYAAQLWMTYIQPLSASGIRLGAPAVSSAGSGRVWLASFLAACTNCKIDFIPLHWYGEGVGNFYDYIWSMHGEFGNWPLWVTEYADTTANNSVVLDFLDQSASYMDTLPWIERYSWFAYFRQGAGSSYNLLDSNGNLNNLGEIYVK